MNLRQQFFPKRDKTQHLRETLLHARSTESLDSLPDRFANIIERYDSITDAEPAFRHDVYAILGGACDVAESMVDPTFPIEEAGTVIAEMMTTLAKALSYLQARPSAHGFSLLMPGSQGLQGQYSTREEANAARERFITLGVSKQCLVVPTRVLSQHAVQPRRQKVLAQPTDPQAEPIPRGILPPKRPVAVPPVELLNEATKEITGLIVETPPPAFTPRPAMPEVKPFDAADSEARVSNLETRLKDMLGNKPDGTNTPRSPT